MTDPVMPQAAKTVDSMPNVARTIIDWLASPLDAALSNELVSLRSHLLALRNMPLTFQQYSEVLDRLYVRSITVLTGLLPELTGLPLPLPRKARQLVRNLQDLLRMLAEDMLATLPKSDGPVPQGLALWRGMYALNQHLMISDLVAAPPGVGVWRQLHQAYALAQGLQLADIAVEGETRTLQQIYYAALLLGCAQPASFTSQETEFVISYIRQFADHVDSLAAPDSGSRSIFWIDPQCDTPPVAYLRKMPPPDISVHYFACDRLATLLSSQLLEFRAGRTSEELGLPDFAASVAGRGVMRRLASYWGKPGKRRYQRRRQNYRAMLCSGFDNLWRLFQEGHPVDAEVSNWMVTNESPDGYAIMHVSGKPGTPSVGDILALRTESSDDWSIGIFRWALSENPEHLEFGVQILASGAVPAVLAQPAETSEEQDEESNQTIRLPVLILPEIPRLRSTQMLVLPLGGLRKPQQKLVLVISRENVEVREVRATHLDERTGSVEMFSIQSEEKK